MPDGSRVVMARSLLITYVEFVWSTALAFLTVWYVIVHHWLLMNVHASRPTCWR
jgi:hypothetical protein